MADGKFIAYYRVSTTRQGRSGLGLEAQQSLIRNFLNGGSWELVAEFTEIESGKSDKNRPQLAAAMMACKRLKATLVVANVARFSRNLAFVAGQMDKGFKFVAADMPDANELTLHVVSAVDQATRKTIGINTKAALRAAKARGVQLGTNGKLLARKYRQEALGRAVALSDTVRELQATNPTVRALAEALNARGVPTPKGKPWQPGTVHRLLRRIEKTQNSSAA